MVRGRLFALVAASQAMLGAFTIGSFAQDAGPVVLTTQVEIESIRPSFTHPGRIEAIRTGSVRPVLRAQIVDMNITAGAMAVSEGIRLRLVGRFRSVGAWQSCPVQILPKQP